MDIPLLTDFSRSLMYASTLFSFEESIFSRISDILVCPHEKKENVDSTVITMIFLIIIYRSRLLSGDSKDHKLYKTAASGGIDYQVSTSIFLSSLITLLITISLS